METNAECYRPNWRDQKGWKGAEVRRGLSEETDKKYKTQCEGWRHRSAGSGLDPPANAGTKLIAKGRFQQTYNNLSL